MSFYKANAILTFRISSGLTTDPDTGNAIATTTAVVVKALLRKTPIDPNKYRLPGVDTTAIFMTGRALAPSGLPASVRGLRAEAAIGGLSGTFTLLPTVQSAFGFQQPVGDAIEGWFEVQDNG